MRDRRVSTPPDLEAVTMRISPYKAARVVLSRLLLAGAAAVLAGAAAATEPPTLRLGSDEWPPFTGSPGTKRAALDLVHSALDRAGVAVETTISEWKEVETAIRRGELDGSAAMWRSERREKDLLFSQPYLENRLILIGRSGSDVSARRLTDLAGKRLAVVRSYAYGESIDHSVGVLFVGTHNDQDSLDRLLAGDVEYMLVDELVVRHLLDFQPEEVERHLEVGLHPLVRRPLHFAIRRNVPGAEEIVAAFNAEVLKMLGDGSYAEILQVGWIRVDVDGDGLYELVPFGEHVGDTPPGRVYDVFGELPEETPTDKHRVVIRGSIYEGWDAIPEQYRMRGPAGVMDTTFRQGTTLMTLKF